MRTQVKERGTGRAREGGIAFVEHDREHHAGRVPGPHAGEFLVGGYLDGGGVGPPGKLRIVLHDLGGPRGRMDVRLCVFGDGTGGLSALLDATGGDLSALLSPVASRDGLSRRLTELGLRDASDTPPRAVGTEAG